MRGFETLLSDQADFASCHGAVQCITRRQASTRGRFGAAPAAKARFKRLIPKRSGLERQACAPSPGGPQEPSVGPQPIGDRVAALGVLPAAPAASSPGGQLALSAAGSAGRGGGELSFRGAARTRRGRAAAPKPIRRERRTRARSGGAACRGQVASAALLARR